MLQILAGFPQQLNANYCGPLVLEFSPEVFVLNNIIIRNDLREETSRACVSDNQVQVILP